MSNPSITANQIVLISKDLKTMKIGSGSGSSSGSELNLSFHNHDEDEIPSSLNEIYRDGYKKFTIRESFGPGLWFAIHVEGRRSIGDLKKNFPLFMENIIKNIRCKTCNEHANQYLSSHPIEPYFDVKNEKGEEIGCFKWTWEFHNTVNMRLNKQIVDFQTAYDMFTPGENSEFSVCSAACTETGSDAASRTTEKSRLSSQPLFFRLKGRGL